MVTISGLLKRASYLINRRRILVVGSCHLDVYADFPQSTIDRFDHIGEIKFSIGGTGFNLATNLARRGHKVSILSIIKKDSVVGDIVMFKLQQLAISTKLILHETSFFESGFVVHREAGQPIRAVTATLFEKTVLTKEFLQRAIKAHSSVVLECNATEHQIAEIVRICAELKVPLFIGAVSDAKANRLLAANVAVSDQSVSVVSMNELEAKALGIDVSQFEISDIYASEIAQRLRAQCVCITLGPSGLLLRERTGRVVKLEAPKISRVVSSSGAGDAVLSAIVEWKLGDHEDIDTLERIIAQYVLEVLGTEEANIGGSAATDRFLVLRKKAPIIVRVGRNAVVFNYVTLLGTLLSIVGILAAVRKWW